MSPSIRDGAMVRITSKDLPAKVVSNDIVAYFVENKLFVHRVLWKIGEILCVNSDRGPDAKHQISISAVVGTVTEICNETRLRKVLRKVMGDANRI